MENHEVVKGFIARGVIAEAVPILIEKMKENIDYQVIIAGYSLGKHYKAKFLIFPLLVQEEVLPSFCL